MNATTFANMAEGIVVHTEAASHVAHRIGQRLARYTGGYTSDKLQVYGNNPIAFTNELLPEYVNWGDSQEVLRFSRWAIAKAKHANFVAKHPELFFSLFTRESKMVAIKHAGILTKWEASDIEFLYFKPEIIDSIFDEYATPLNEEMARDIGLGRRKGWVLDAKYAREYSFTQTEQVPEMLRFKWYVKRALLLNKAINIFQRTQLNIGQFEFTFNGVQASYTVVYSDNNFNSVTPVTVNGALDFVSSMTEPLTLENLRIYRTEFYREMIANADVAKRDFDERKFANYWESLKESAKAHKQNEIDAAKDFATIPVLSDGNTSSRTWGIEIETVHAERTSRPAGWKQVSDGSLEAEADDEYDDCECGCEDCTEYESHCGYSDCVYRNSSCAEFVSPILSHFNSNGLSKLCNDIGMYGHNSTPGIHVHVGASDLTVQEAARLVFAYGAIAPLFESIYHRETYGYCKPTPAHTMRVWLQQLSAYRKTSDANRKGSAYDVVRSENIDRYLDLNLTALYKHGTVEFRAMGPWYDYNHLVRWAWVCREMVNVSKIDLPQRVWTSCKSIADVVKVLRTYGVEIPYDKDLMQVIEFDGEQA